MELSALVDLAALYPQFLNNSIAGSDSTPLFGTATLIIKKNLVNADIYYILSEQQTKEVIYVH
jgi:hypothetical protein